jgi:hypothetical protein
VRVADQETALRHSPLTALRRLEAGARWRNSRINHDGRCRVLGHFFSGYFRLRGWRPIEWVGSLCVRLLHTTKATGMARHNGKYISYLRVSTAKQEQSGLGLEGQRAAVETWLNGGNWQLVEEVVEVESGKSHRPAAPAPNFSERLHHGLRFVDERTAGPGWKRRNVRVG